MLLVWLPLNKEGNFYNLGLSNVIITNNGVTYNTNGKIGGCYSFGDGTSSNQHKGISINTNFSLIGESRSICAWVRPKGNHLHYSGAIVSSGNWNSSRWGFCLKLDNTGFTGFDSGYDTYYYTDIPVNSWTHLCVTVENGITKFYKNGEYLGELSRGSGSVFSDAANTMIGRETYADGYFSFNGDISDARIYSHALSPKEIHEIAKGLVLHYPMNDEYVESIVYDCSGYCNNGTITGNLLIVDDSPRYKKSAKFNGINSIINTNYNYNNLGNNFTISSWLKSNVNSSGTYLTAAGNELSNGGIVFGEISATNKLLCYLNGNTGTDINICAYNSFEANKWYHVVYKVTNALSSNPVAELFINGNSVDIKTGTLTFGEPELPIYIGANRLYRWWNGNISDFRIYSTALSEDDIKELYNTSAWITNNGTLAAYELNEE